MPHRGWSSNHRNEDYQWPYLLISQLGQYVASAKIERAKRCAIGLHQPTTELGQIIDYRIGILATAEVASSS